MIKQTLLDPRPADVPDGWLIFNAPRPLCGDKCWTGEFRHGVFYSAVNPADRLAVQFIEQNDKLDGYLTEYAAPGAAKAAFVTRLAEYNKGRTDDSLLDIADFDEDDFIRDFMRQNGRVEVTLESVLSNLKVIASF